MLIQESHVDIPTSSTPMRLFIFHPVIPSGQKARFPAVAVFTEIYQVTAPITRFCRQLAGRGFIAAGCSSYHEFMGPEALAYDDAGTNIYNVIKLGTKLGNDLKVEKTLEGYDEDAKLTIDYLVGLETCNGRVGATGAQSLPMSELMKGMCLGGHLAFRAAFDPRVLASVCFFGTDIHSETLGKGKKSDSLKRCKEIKGELVMIFGKKVSTLALNESNLRIPMFLHQAEI